MRDVIAPAFLGSRSLPDTGTVQYCRIGGSLSPVAPSGLVGRSQISTTDRTLTREPDPTHNELKHTITRKTATHERNPDTPHIHTGR